jgi:hypothetical protein
MPGGAFHAVTTVFTLREDPCVKRTQMEESEIGESYAVIQRTIGSYLFAAQTRQFLQAVDKSMDIEVHKKRLLLCRVVLFIHRYYNHSL